MTNIVTAVFDECGCAQTETVFQYDYGQILKIEGVELPQSYEVHFSNDRYGGETTTQIGGADGVNIPDAYLQSGQMVYAFIFLHAGADDGETEYVITIPVAKRPEITSEVPTPVEQSAITQAIAALNAAVEQTAQDAESAAQSATEAQSALDNIETALASKQDKLTAGANITIEGNVISATGGGGGGGAVDSVNGQTGDVVLSASDVHALPDSTVIPSKTSDLTNDSGFITSVPVSSVNGKTGAVSLNASDVGALPSSTTIPTKTSDLTNDSGFITSAPVSSVNGQTGAVSITASGLGAYVKPSSGIPKTDLASAVQTSLGKADTALQTAPVTSVNGMTGAVVIPTATTSANGLMSSADKALLDSVTERIASTLPVNTVTGATVSVADGADNIPVKDLTVAITPTQSGSGDPSPDNVRPISGWTGVNVTVCGVNVWDEDWEQGALVNGDPVSTTNTIRSKNFTKCAEGQAFYIKSPATVFFHFYKADKTFLQRSSSIANDVLTVPAGAFYFKISSSSNYGGTYNNDISVNYPSTDTAYHAYNGETYAIDWQSTAGTVYGGTLDVTTGVLTSTLASDGTELATPQTYQLTPTEVSTLLGANNVWADTGDTTLTYRTSLQPVYDDYSSALVALNGGD